MCLSSVIFPTEIENRHNLNEYYPLKQNGLWITSLKYSFKILSSIIRENKLQEFFFPPMTFLIYDSKLGKNQAVLDKFGLLENKLLILMSIF